MKENKIVNSKAKSWVKPIYTLFVVAIPAILIWLFFSGDIPLSNINLNLWEKSLVSLGFIIVIFLLTSLLIYFRIIPITILTFALPVAICFMVIFLSSDLVSWARALIVIPFLFFVIPINIICNKIEMRQKAKIALKSKNNNEKIIGYIDKNQKSKKK